MIFRELSALYPAFLEGKPSPLPDLPLQYVDYTLWQCDEAGGSAMRAHLDYWTERIAHLLQACANDRDKLPAEQSIDIPFHELIKDDIGMVEKIYHKANMAMTAKARNELGRFVDAHRDDYGKVIYDLKGQFGSDPDLLRERFNFYYDAFPVKRGKG